MFDPEILLGIYSTDAILHVKSYLYIIINCRFILNISLGWKQCKYLLLVWWLIKLWFIHTMKYCAGGFFLKIS